MHVYLHTVKSLITQLPTRPYLILVTGSHRSGSTWVGRMIASAPNTFYVRKPLNASFAPCYYWTDTLPCYPRFEDPEYDRIRDELQEILSGSFPRINATFFRPDKYLRYRCLHALTFRHAAWKKSTS